ncbi:MAG: hypothetical protein ACKOPO_12110 [Novosphingobium sp.]
MIAALALALLAPAVLAQPVTDFRLQPRETPTSKPQGPVDSDAPVVRPTARPTPSEPAPAPEPAPTAPAATPSPTATGGESEPPAPAAQAPAQRPAPNQNAGNQRGQGAAPAALPDAAQSLNAAPAAAPSEQAEAPLVVETFGPSPSSGRAFAFDWSLLALPAGLLALLLVWLKMRGKPRDEWEDEAVEEAALEDAQTIAAPDPEPSPAPVAAAPALAAPIAEPATEKPAEAMQPAVAIAPVNDPNGALTVSLEVGRMNATLVNAALTWKLTIVNSGDKPLGPVIVAGDMIAAHVSLPVEQQLATDGQPLELIKEIAAIAPGDEAEVTGEFRVSLASISPIKAGSALLYIPLVRFRVEAEGASTLATFAIGETPPVAAAALLPFRLDLGPRVWSRISHRQVDREPLSA